MLGCATGSDQRKRARRSMSPDSSKVSHTAATCETVKLSVGNANIGLGIKGGGGAGGAPGEVTGGGGGGGTGGGNVVAGGGIGGGRPSNAACAATTALGHARRTSAAAGVAVLAVVS